MCILLTEIGCDNGKSFNEIINTSKSLHTATCVDPNIESIATHHLPSDDFFATLEPDINIPTTIGPNHSPILSRYDVVFVDGLHEANQAYRDVIHALRVLIPGRSSVVCNNTMSNQIKSTHPFTFPYSRL